MPTIAIVEDDADLRRSMMLLLRASGKWRVTCEHGRAEDALPVLLRHPPDIVLMDINLPGMSGIDCVRQLKAARPDALVLMVTVYESSDQVFAALAAGASGYLLKRDAPERLLPFLEEIMAGGAPMSSHIARQVVRFFHQPQKAAAPEKADLTARERQILELLATGALYKEIAADLGIGVETVNTHIRSIYSKLHVRSRTEAVLKFLQNG